MQYMHKNIESFLNDDLNNITNYNKQYYIILGNTIGELDSYL